VSNADAGIVQMKVENFMGPLLVTVLCSTVGLVISCFNADKRSIIAAEQRYASKHAHNAAHKATVAAAKMKTAIKSHHVSSPHGTGFRRSKSAEDLPGAVATAALGNAANHGGRGPDEAAHTSGLRARLAAPQDWAPAPNMRRTQSAAPAPAASSPMQFDQLERALRPPALQTEPAGTELAN
jgi:hypothetical protein